MSSSSNDAIGYLIVAVIVIAIVIAVIAAVLSIGVFILAGIAGVGIIGGLIKGTINFFEVLEEAHAKLP